MMRWSRGPGSRKTPTGWLSSGGTAPERSFLCSPSGKSQKPSWIEWSRTLGSDWERYLRQQIELGGDEVVLSRVINQAPASARHSERSEESASGTSLSDRDRTSSRPIARSARDDGGVLDSPAPATEPRWKQGCPPIPGPGLVVESASHGLDDELVALGTLDQVAERIRTTHCCALCPNRTLAVPGEGNPSANLFLVGEGPGATED